MRYHYRDYDDEMILRDHLAYDRTKFALVRTFLSICRTALGLLASGAGLIILQTSRVLVSIGCMLVLAAAVVMAIGGAYCWRARVRLNGLRMPQGNDDRTPDEDRDDRNDADTTAN